MKQSIPFKLALLVLLILALPISIYLANKAVEYVSKGAEADNSAQVILKSSDNSITSPIAVSIRSTYPVGFVKLVLEFNPLHIRFKQAEYSPDTPNVIFTTPTAEANSNGVLELVAAVDESSYPSSLYPEFYFAQLHFEPNPQTTSPSTTISINSFRTEVVQAISQEFVRAIINITDYSYTIPTITPTPTPAPQPTPTPIITKPTPTPEATSTPSPIPSPTTTPSLTPPDDPSPTSTSSATPTPFSPDLNQDGQVDIFDYSQCISKFPGQCTFIHLLQIMTSL